MVSLGAYLPVRTPSRLSRADHAKQMNERPNLKSYKRAANVRFWGAPCEGGAFQWVQVPPGELLQPEATGAGMEVTKCLKPPDDGHVGDRASVQAAT